MKSPGDQNTPLEDFLIPGEEIRFRSTSKLRYGDKPYEVLVTTKRLLLYASRGVVVKNDDVVSVRMDELLGVKYRESGILVRTGILEIQGKTLMQLMGPPAETKALYQQLMAFL